VDSWSNAGTIHASLAESPLHASVSSSSTRKMHFPGKHCPAPLPRPSWLISCIRGIRWKEGEKGLDIGDRLGDNLLVLNSFPSFSTIKNLFFITRIG